jgi:nitrite reductase (NADH) small subunit
VTQSGQAVAVCAADDLAREGKRVVNVGDVPVLLMWNDGEPRAFHDTCIHRARSLSDAVVFAGKLVCAGHQWSFEIDTGYCAVREKYQPTFAVTVSDGLVHVDVPEGTTAIPQGASQQCADAIAVR